jgi:UDP-N-acetylglucosamine 2-epimerase (non-hydrolysing)
MKVCIVLGTRPEIIKACSLIRCCEQRGTDYFIIHTGQHYSYDLDKLFFEELKLPVPKYNLKSGGKQFRFQLNSMLSRIKIILEKEKPNIVLVIGDTNSVLAGALAANKLNIPIGHIEAGLRSEDLVMLEETNRIVVDNISDFLFSPTDTTRNILIGEGFKEDKIFVTGNTVVDAVYQNSELAENSKNIVEQLGLNGEKFAIVTMHRPENVDVYERFKNTLDGLKLVSENMDFKLIWAIHPRAKKMVDKFNLKIPEKIKIISPLGYLDFLQLQKNASLVLTDSGGIQEESCVLKVPCVTLRDNT